MNVTLTEIVSQKREEVTFRKKQRPADSFAVKDSHGNGSFKRAICGSGLHFICEVKPKSPTAGVLRKELSLASIMASFAKHASAISVLTDETFFGGSFALLQQIRAMSGLPILCKDFIIDPYQCFEAKEAGADAVLLIAKILTKEELGCLHAQVIELGMLPVLEIQNESELAKTKDLDTEVTLINNRNLDSFAIDLATTLRLAPLLSADSIKIAASGIHSRADVERLLPATNNILIGSALMKAADLEAKLCELKGSPFARTGNINPPPNFENGQL